MSVERNQPAEARRAAGVAKHLDRAIKAAQEVKMPTGELLGLFFYYAHSIATSYREDVMKKRRVSRRVPREAGPAGDSGQLGRESPLK